jgi:hypothetical protein
MNGMIRRTFLVAILPALVVAVLVIAASRDHYFRDEFYYLACSHRMAWGYVDQPPFSIAVLWVVRHLFGESLMVLRVTSAAAFAALMFVTAGIARRLGGGAFAELLAMVGVAVAPGFIGIAGYYSMNVFDLLLWSLAVRVFIDALDQPSMGRWVLLGGLLGVGLLNKISVLWLGAGLVAALVLTSARRQLLTPGPYVAAAIATVLFMPHLLWQIANHWPTLEFIRNASSEKMVQNTPWSFVLDQIKNQHPVALPLWGAGLLALLWHPRLRRFRALAIIYLAVAAVLIVNRTSRAGYLALAYPMLLAAGAVFWEGVIVRPAARAATLLVLILAGAATLPLTVPLLATDTYVRYSRTLGVAPSTEEKKELGRLPQFFADRQGWDAFVSQVVAVWNTLPAEDRARAAVLTGNYGEAGAIERLAHGPLAISGHNNYWLWGPRGRTGDVLIVLSRHPERLQRLFARVEKGGETDCGDCMPYENHLGIYLCRDMYAPLSTVWPDLKHFD